MPRALTAEWHQVEAADRAAAIAVWRTRRHRIAAAGCHYWVFASTRPGTYLEFIEARDQETLARARAEAGLPAATEILTELELS